MVRGSSSAKAPSQCLYYSLSQGTLERDDWERLPLHYAVLGRAPPAVVAALAKAYPEAVVAKDDMGEDTPLDLARKNRSSAEVLATLEWAAEQAAGSAWVPFQLSDTQTSTWTVSEEDESQPYSPTSDRLQRGFLPPLLEGSTEKPSEGRSSVGEPIQPTPGGEVASSPGGFLPMRDLASQLTSPPISDLDGVRRSLSTEDSLDLRTEPSVDGHYYDSATSSQLAAAFAEHHSPPRPPPPPWDANCPPLDLMPPFTPPPPQNTPPGSLTGTLGRESGGGGGGGGGGRCSTGGLATGSSAGGTWTHATSPQPPMPTPPLPSSRQEKPAAPSVVARPAAYTDLAVETLARRKEDADAADAAAARVAAAAVAAARVAAAAVAAEAAAETLEVAAEELAAAEAAEAEAAEAAEAAAAAAEASPSLKRKPSPAGLVLSPLAKRQSPLHAAASAPAIPDFPFGLLPSAAGVPLANPPADVSASADAPRKSAPAPRSYDDVARETAAVRARRSSESREQLAELRASVAIDQEQAAETEARAAAAASAIRASLQREQLEEERTLAQLAGDAPQPTPPQPPPLLVNVSTKDAPLSPTRRDSLSPMRAGLKQPASPSSPNRAAAELAKIERAHVAARMDAAKQHLAESAAAKERLAALLANRPQSMGSASVFIPAAAAPIAPISAVETSDSGKQASGPSAEAVQAQQEWLRAEVARSMSPTATAAAAGQQAGAATGAANGVAGANGVGGTPVASPSAAEPARPPPSDFEKQMTGLEKQMQQGLEAAKVAGEKLMKEVESVACIMCVSPRSQRPAARPPPTPTAPTAPTAPAAPAAPIGAA